MPLEGEGLGCLAGMHGVSPAHSQCSGTYRKLMQADQLLDGTIRQGRKSLKTDLRPHPSSLSLTSPFQAV